MFRSKNKNPGFWIPAVKAGTENPGFLFLKDLVVFHRCSHVIETAALIQIYILQRADQGSITFEMNERIVTHTAGHKGRILFIDALDENFLNCVVTSREISCTSARRRSKRSFTTSTGI